MSRPLYLIVDDEPELRSYLRLFLQRQGAEILEAEDAVTALRILKKLAGEVDLLITDIQMPGEMDGVDLGYSVKNQFPSVPVILVSGAVEKPPTDFVLVRKPYRHDEILSAIERVTTKTNAGGAR